MKLVFLPFLKKLKLSVIGIPSRATTDKKRGRKSPRKGPFDLMDTADNRNYGLPRRGGTKGCSTAKDRTGTSFDNLTFYEGTVPKEERLACKAFHSLPSPQIEGRRKPFVPPFFSLPMLQTVDYDYRDFIGRIFLRMLYRFLFLHIVR